MNDYVKLSPEMPASVDAASSINARILAIGDIDIWRETCGDIPTHRGLEFGSIDLLKGAYLTVLRPHLIVSPVVAPNFDCLDVAYALFQQSFGGAYRALARSTPKPAMIRKEVRAICPGLDFEIIPLDGKTDFLS